MVFSTNMAMLVADQVSRFVTLNRHQLAGQVANLDFWLAQVHNALEVIDGYGVRFVQMHGVQEQYVAGHGTTEFTLRDKFSKPTKAAPPRRIPDRELQKTRKLLIEAASRFLARCRKEGFISEERLLAACVPLGIGIDSVAW
ncbi:MAG: hypothetical protein EXS16_14030 [Gemmataceae bacterium]|nr:hypothetical protein [Gemmataceae bacterium]